MRRRPQERKRESVMQNEKVVALEKTCHHYEHVIRPTPGCHACGVQHSKRGRRGGGKNKNMFKNAHLSRFKSADYILLPRP